MSTLFCLQKAKSLIAKKEEGNKHFRAGKLQAAYKLYTEALEIDPYNKFTNSKLYNNRATVLTKVRGQRTNLLILFASSFPVLLVLQ